MTIEKGKPWGAAAPLPDDGVVVRSDAEARVVLEEARHQGRPYPSIGLLGGDLCRTLGGTGDALRLRSADARTFHIDLGELTVDGRRHLFVAHLVVTTMTWRRATVIMNAQWIGAWNVGHRAHPNDGLLDVYQADLRLSDLVKVRRRLPSGSFLPHPRIAYRRARETDLDLGAARAIRLDGQLVGGGRRLSVRLVPDALRVVV